MTATDRAMAREEWARIGALGDRVTIDDALLGTLRDRIRELQAALRSVGVTTCREWCDDKADHCHAPAEFLIWGKLIPPNGLGPRCYDHAAEHVGHRALGDPSWAIVDLRPARSALGIDEEQAP